MLRMRMGTRVGRRVGSGRNRRRGSVGIVLVLVVVLVVGERSVEVELLMPPLSGVSGAIRSSFTPVTAQTEIYWLTLLDSARRKRRGSGLGWGSGGIRGRGGLLPRLGVVGSRVIVRLGINPRASRMGLMGMRRGGVRMGLRRARGPRGGEEMVGGVC